MNKLIALLFLFILFNTAQAQYSSYRKDYTKKDYSHLKSDKYNPTLAGVFLKLSL